MDRACTQPRPPRPEAGFGVVELMVCMVILAVLMGVAIVTFRGSEGVVRDREAEAVVASYDQAFGRFLVDHGNRPPTAQDMAPMVDGKPLGPKDLLGKAYLRSVPEAVAGGRVGVKLDPQSPTSAECSPNLTSPAGAGNVATGWITYCVELNTDGTPRPGYALRLATRREGGSWTDPQTAGVCFRGKTGRQPRCTF